MLTHADLTAAVARMLLLPILAVVGTAVAMLVYALVALLGASGRRSSRTVTRSRRPASYRRTF